MTSSELCFPDTAGQEHMCELPAIVPACKGAAQAQSRLNLSMKEREMGMNSATSRRDVSFDNCWKKENWVSIMM